MDEGHMFTDNVPMARYVHDGTLTAQVGNRRVLKLRAVQDFNSDSIAGMRALKALGAPYNTKVAHANDELKLVAALTNRPPRINLHRVAPMRSRKPSRIVRLHHNLFL